MRLNVAYLINQYPKVGHRVIRRETHALEQQGLTVTRYALRGWGDTLSDPLDVAGRPQVRYVLQGGSDGLPQLHRPCDAAQQQSMARQDIGAEAAKLAAHFRFAAAQP